MAKRRRKSQTLWVNGVSAVAGAVAMAVLATSHELKDAIPGWAYISLLVASNIYNFWRRGKTDEEIKK